MVKVRYLFVGESDKELQATRKKLKNYKLKFSRGRKPDVKTEFDIKGSGPNLGFTSSKEYQIDQERVVKDSSNITGYYEFDDHGTLISFNLERGMMMLSRKKQLSKI